MTTQQTPVPRGHCGTIDRGDPETGALYTRCVCGAPYADTIIAAELTRMARTLTAEDDLPDIGHVKTPGITPEAAASVLGMTVTASELQHDPARVLRMADARGSVTVTDDEGRPRMVIGGIAPEAAPLETTNVPSYEAGRRDAFAQVRAIWQRWMDDDDANDVDALAEIAGLFDDDAPAVLTLDDVARLANEWSAEHARKDPGDLDGQAAMGAFVGWMRQRVEVSHGE